MERNFSYHTLLRKTYINGKAKVEELKIEIEIENCRPISLLSVSSKILEVQV